MESYEKRGVIFAANAQEFGRKVQALIAQPLIDIAAGSRVLAIQFADIDDGLIKQHIYQHFMRTDGQFVFEGCFRTGGEILEEIKPFCKQISISYLPKSYDDKDKFLLENEKRKRFGRINYCELNLKNMTKEGFWK